MLLDITLGKTPLPRDALLCTVTCCKVYSKEINEMHEHIISPLLDASYNYIPVFKPLVSTVMSGWNETCSLDLLCCGMIYGKPMGNLVRELLQI